MVEKTRAAVLAQLTAAEQPFELVPGHFLGARVCASRMRPKHCATSSPTRAATRHLSFMAMKD